MIKTERGNFSSDFCVSSPSTKMVYIRILGRTLADVENIFGGVETVQYISEIYTGCTFRFAFEEGDAVKVGMSYETKREYI